MNLAIVSLLSENVLYCLVWCLLSAGESAVHVDGSERCTEVDRLWVCKANEHVQVAADSLLHAVLCRQVLCLLI